MAIKGSPMSLIVFFISTLFASAASQSSSSCTSALVSLSPCLNFITGNETTPSSSCCSNLASVVKSEPRCLCTVLGGGAASGLGVAINQTQALALPSACKVQTPPASQCSTSSTPSSPPSASSPSTPNSSSGSGSKNVPTLDTNSANGSMPFILSLVFLVLFSSASAVTA